MTEHYWHVLLRCLLPCGLISVHLCFNGNQKALLPMFFVFLVFFGSFLGFIVSPTSQTGFNINWEIFFVEGWSKKKPAPKLKIL